MTFEIAEDQRQLILLALALMTVRHGPRPGFAFAALEVADALGGIPAQEMFKEFQRYNAQDPEAP